MAPQIIWAGSASRELRKLEREVQTRILAETRRLSLEALPPGSKKLSGHPLHRVRVGDFRIVYQYQAENDAVVVLKVAHRKDAYKRIPELR